MDKPHKYVIFDKRTKELTETNIQPSHADLFAFVPVAPNISQRVQVKEVYIDTRYEAKLRLYNYVTYTRKGLPVPRYKLNIDKNEPILNF